MKQDVRYIFEDSKPGRVGYSLPSCDVPEANLPENLTSPEVVGLPEVSESEVVRHFTGLARQNFGVDTGFYPLGSCTMKYNPKINEEIASNPRFTNIHPDAPKSAVQGILAILHQLEHDYCEITGMDAFTLIPAAGAHGEWTGMSIIKAYHTKRGETQRTKVLIPDSAHGTNPASAAAAGFDVVTIKSDGKGGVDVEDLIAHMDDTVAGLMLTNPNTVGIFDSNIMTIANVVHERGGLLYYDGANLNALMGMSRPGDFGFDVVHLNLHKTFSTPHGAGGPGSAPIGVKKELAKFLPAPVIVKDGDSFRFDFDRPDSMGTIMASWGHVLVCLKAYCYNRMMGADGLREATKHAVLAANYVRVKLNDLYPEGYPGICMHECVLSGSKLKDFHVKTLDVSKRLMDYGFHPPTNYFPLIVDEAIMIEPTETENKATLDAFIDAMRAIFDEAKEGKIDLHSAPFSTHISRVDEAQAARTPKLKWE
ncbi:MAG TPA: aminomethyl-transferring glycine dehydrogenase subunit GcvPB [Caldisericia bacterium]|nr:aminomethyl-transferring glycine dehydrogenase subunit GcvPB [Caldisericia bacterium]HPF49640.1 aminomethyl-transferring glycine dehydrogenase subunit GcvPB [Caldisericia bacterium]HPI84622.1 aminomethyl-transferring glycine dehydrogenase subunit GcvPB [Caldisericia bacterium]HPQ92168.1 aminomethyl-transferring glycine dehydrogenase subunit GcvPB [Caldisericia bacterium]HRV74734.1 aminomethyl-transferring glycine dehydrogenase subunit GcvPB [Caldisericia bacterium]